MTSRILLDPQGGEGNGNGKTDETKPTEADKGGARGTDLSKAAEGLVARHGDPTAALLVLLGENYQLRDKFREASAKVPAEGTLVLKEDEVRDWQHYRGLGKPGDLKKALDAGEQHAAENGSFRKEKLVNAVAEVARFKPGVLLTLVDRDRLAVEVVEQKDKDGKAVRVAVVKGDGDQVTRLDEYAAAHWGDFLPSLAVAPPEQRTNGTPTIAPRQPAAAATGPPRRYPTTSF